MTIRFRVNRAKQDRLFRNMRRLPQEIAEHVHPAGLKAAAEVVVEEAKRIVPVDTGELRRSIRSAFVPAIVNLPRGPKRLRRGAIEIRAGGKRVDYAGYVEFGTIIARAQPYLRPALYNTRQRQLRASASQMRKAMRFIATRLER